MGFTSTKEHGEQVKHQELLSSGKITHGQCPDFSPNGKGICAKVMVCKGGYNSVYKGVWMGWRDKWCQGLAYTCTKCQANYAKLRLAVYCYLRHED